MKELQRRSRSQLDSFASNGILGEGGDLWMLRLSRKEMDRKLRLVMEFIKVPEEQKERTEYAVLPKREKDS